MEFKINRETVPAAECIYDGIQEQSVELDYILPDYYPDIFRLIRCRIEPVITNSTVNGDKLNYELRCDIKVLYCGEEDTVIRCVSQTQSFSKTVDIGRDCDNAAIELIPKTGFVNYRAVNKRRLDIRGAVSVKIKVTGEKEQEVITDAEGMNIQLKKVPVRFASKTMTIEKVMRISEETELSPAQPSIMSIIGVRCTANDIENKLISGKLLVKGELEAKVLYACESDGEGAAELMVFSLPFSQIMDIDEIDESFDCSITTEVVSCDVTPASGKNGDNRMLRCEAELRIKCSAVKTGSAMLVTDAYSTVYPCELSISEIKTEQIPVIYSESFRSNVRIAEGEQVPEKVYAMWCVPKNINTRIADDGHSVVITGMLTYSMAAKDASGMMIMPDKDEAFEETIELGDDISGSSLTSDIKVREVSYNITSEGILSAKADISAEISVSGSSVVNAVTDISIDDTAKKERDGDYSMKLYYGAENEDIWDIAKRYSTSVDAVREENDIDGDKIENGGMLLIPIIN